MFNKLVVSSSERRSKRPARFFFGTSIIYLIVVAGALALSVFFANPRLADSSTTRGITITPVLPQVLGERRNKPYHEQFQVRPRQDLRSTRRLEDILADPESAHRLVRMEGPPRPPGGTTISQDGGGGFGDPNGVRDGLPQSIQVPAGHGSVTDPPEPADPVGPKGRPRPIELVRLASSVLQGKAVARRTPDYPPLAKQIRLEGAVSVEVMIAPDGHVESARAVSGPTLLVYGAVEAARSWRFEPTLLNGTPVRVTGIIIFNFKLN